MVVEADEAQIPFSEEQQPVQLGESRTEQIQPPPVDSLDRLNVLIPVCFGILLWVSVGMLYPVRGLLSLLVLLPVSIVLAVRFFSKKVSALCTWSQLGTWIGIGLFVEVVVLSLQLLLLFAVSVVAYGVIMHGVWDSQIHGYGDTWQIGLSLEVINVILSVLASFFIFAPLTEGAKFFLAKSIPSSESILTMPKYLALCVISALGIGCMEALVFILIVGGVPYALLQVLICTPLHVLTGLGIALDAGLNPRTGALRILFLPMLVQGLQHFQAYMVHMYAESLVAWIFPYVGFSLLITGVYAWWVRRRFKQVSPAMLVIGEHVDMDSIELELRVEMANQVDTSNMHDAAAAA